MPAAAQDPAPPIPSAAPAGLKLRRLEIENFKAIDKLVLDLPAPLMEDDPDVFVIGSKNGAGKTSLLEACALSVIGFSSRSLFFHIANNEVFPLREHLIRAGAPELRVRATFSGYLADMPNIKRPFSIELPRTGPPNSESLRVDLAEETPETVLERTALSLLSPLFGAVAHPLVFENCLYFHCNRRVHPGAIPSSLAQPAVGSQVEWRGWIKRELLQFLMAQAGLFEDIRSTSVTDTAAVLDDLFRTFADARLSKLRTLPNNAFDIRVQPLDGNGSFSFDALSSGQKEMITTLFLIWQHTRDRPGLVLIDEPELHLNAEWQIKLIRLLFKLAPRNQYILTTHSEFVFRSVQDDRRLLIGPQG